MAVKLCSVEACDGRHRCKGYCGKHYQMWLKWGDPLVNKAIDGSRDPYDDIIKYGVTRVGECLVSNASKGSNGYRRIRAGNKNFLAHRVSFEKWHGTIPSGMVVDHKCHNEAASRGECNGGACHHRACVNPAHLEAVSCLENRMNSVLYVESLGAWQKGKTHCPEGHPYSGENLFMTHQGGRSCLTCRRKQDRIRQKERRDGRRANFAQG